MPTLHYQSARGVYYDIRYSHFISEVKGISFYFTSEFNLTRFEEKQVEFVQEFKKKIESIYWDHHNLEFEELALIRLYMKIEKKGFYLSYKGKTIECQKDITFKTELLLS